MERDFENFTWETGAPEEKPQARYGIDNQITQLPSFNEAFGHLDIDFCQYSSHGPCGLAEQVHRYPYQRTTRDMPHPRRERKKTSASVRKQVARPAVEKQSDSAAAPPQGHHLADYYDLVTKHLLREESVHDVTDVSYERLREIHMSIDSDRTMYTVNMLPAQQRKAKNKRKVQDPNHAGGEASRRKRHNALLHDHDLLSSSWAVQLNRMIRAKEHPKVTVSTTRTPSKEDVLSQALIGCILSRIIIDALLKKAQRFG